MLLGYVVYYTTYPIIFALVIGIGQYAASPALLQ